MKKLLLPLMISALLLFLLPPYIATAQAEPHYGAFVIYVGNGTFAVRDGRLEWADDPGNRAGVVYDRSYSRQPGTTWREIETTPGRYDFSRYLQSQRRALEHNLVFIFRLNPIQTDGARIFPDWLPRRSHGVLDLTTDGARTAYRDLLVAAREEIIPLYAHATLVDMAYAGYSGEPGGSMPWSRWFSSSEWQQITTWMEDVHLEVFGPERLVANADAGSERLHRLWNLGVRWVRQDGVMSWAKEIEYNRILDDPVARQFFVGEGCFIGEVWMGGVNYWNHERANPPDRPNITKSNQQILELFSNKYQGCYFGNMGIAFNSHAPPGRIPNDPVADYRLSQALQGRMQTYAPAKVSRLLSRLSGNDPAPGPAEVADTSQVELTHMTITGVLVYPGDAVTEHPCVGQNRCTLPVGGRVWVSFDTAGFEGFAGPGADLLTPNVAGPSTWSFNTNGRSLVRIEAVYPVPEPDPVPEPVLDEVIALLEAIQAQIDVLETVVQQIQEAQRRAARAVLGEE